MGVRESGSGSGCCIKDAKSLTIEGKNVDVSSVS